MAGASEQVPIVVEVSHDAEHGHLVAEVVGRANPTLRQINQDGTINTLHPPRDPKSILSCPYAFAMYQRAVIANNAPTRRIIDMNDQLIQPIQLCRVGARQRAIDRWQAAKDDGRKTF